MNVHTLNELARERTRQTLRTAENDRLGRRATPPRSALRATLAAAATATGESLLALGQTLSERTE
jgi:hypothetical protein